MNRRVEKTLESKELRKFYCFSGKGGVGKSSLAIAYALTLHKKGVPFHLFTWEKCFAIEYIIKNGYPSFGPHTSVVNESEIMAKYLERKLGLIVSHWLTSTSFYPAIMNLLPSMRYFLCLEYFTTLIIKNPEKIILFDAPSTGHLVVMLEAFKRYEKIFLKGVIFEDLMKTKQLLLDPHFFSLKLISIPLKLVLLELEETLNDLNALGWEKNRIEIIINNSLSLRENDTILLKNKLPSFIKDQIDNEKILINDFNKKHNFKIIPQFLYDSEMNLLEDLALEVEKIF